MARCPQCGASLGLLETGDTTCACCLLATAIRTLEPEDHTALTLARDAPTIAELNTAAPAYEFLELLGRGGGGWVYLATQRSLNRPVAIKLLRRRPAGFESDRQRFQQEAQTLAAFNHPQLVTVHDYGSIETDGGDLHDYLVMEYIAGPTLRQRLAQGPLAAADAKHITRQIAEAMQYAHQRGVVHRDLKPENVLFTSESANADLKVADFGIAKLVDGGSPGSMKPGASHTATGMVVGTPYYMAPEWRSASVEVTPRGDIFSLGVMLYEMLTGQLPVGAFDPPSESHHVPVALSDVAMKALAANPADRFATADELITAISAPMKRQAEPRGGLSTARWMAVALGAALLCFIVYDAFVSPTSEPSQRSASVATKQMTTEELATEETAADSAAEVVEASPEASPAPTAPIRAGEEVEISNVRIPGSGSFRGKLSFELTIRDPELIERLDDGEATLYWVYTRSFDRPMSDNLEGQVPALDGRDQILIDANPRQLHGSMWPAEIHVEERWGGEQGASVGKRRVSRPFRVEAWHMHSTGPY